MKRIINVFVICALFVGAVFAGGQAEEVTGEESVQVSHEVSGAYPFVLRVYGNADMNDILDENDIEYVKGIISGNRGKTQFADANYDGIVDEADITHIESIIAGDDIALTLVDNRGVTVTLDVPVNRAAVLFSGAMRPVLHLNAADRIVGIGSRIISQVNVSPWISIQAYPDLLKLTQVGTTNDPNQEALVSVMPDVILGTLHTDSELSKTISMNTGIPFVYGNPCKENFIEGSGAYETWRKIALLFGNKERERAEELIKYCDNQIREVQQIADVISEEDKVKVVIFCYGTTDNVCTVHTNYEPLNIAGGINVAGTLGATGNWGATEVSPEQIILWNPDIILFHSYSITGNFISKDEILSNSNLQTVNAIKNKRVYGTKAWSAGWDPATALCECFYMAKLFYPELFKEMNVEARGNEILEEFYGAPNLYDWMLENCGDYYTWK